MLRKGKSFRDAIENQQKLNLTTFQRPSTSFKSRCSQPKVKGTLREQSNGNNHGNHDRNGRDQGMKKDNNKYVEDIEDEYRNDDITQKSR